MRVDTIGIERTQSLELAGWLDDELQASFRDAYRNFLAPGGQQPVGLEPVTEHDEVLGLRNDL